MFQPVNPKNSFPELEERILKFWAEKDVFTRSVELRPDRPLFVFYEGPPTANGKPGIHHVLSRVYKDIILRYRTMTGYVVPRKAGWDTHGLPVELEVEKKLGFSGKQQIEEYGVAKFNALCRESVWTYLKEWDRMTERIAFWLDMDKPYITMDDSYVESVWWAIKQLWDKQLVYQGHKVTPHCPRCGTSLSSHEVALGYKDDADDPSIFIKFKLVTASGTPGLKLAVLLKSPIPTYLLAWTTTPWTLPGNTALAVAPEAEYAVVELESEAGKERLVLARARLSHAIKGEYKLVATFSGRDLVGGAYEPLFPPSEFGVPIQQFGGSSGRTALQSIYEPAKAARPATGEGPATYPVISGDFVSMEDGTGIVHIAPAFGEIDYDTGAREGLHFVQHVDLAGKITGTYPFAGKFVKKADPQINEILKERNLLFRSERLTHTYPFCWRCDTPLLYFAKQSWYIRTTAFKEKLIAGNEHIGWYPEHIKHGRFGDWLQNNVDWAFSRERYWGTPLPVWQCQGCGHSECAGSREEILKLVNLAESERKRLQRQLVDGATPDLLGDLHRPYIDDVILKCPRCQADMVRRTEVIDCWFDSGAMPFAQWHYPFENRDVFGQNAQADFISEAVDQTRGWFYSLHALSTMLFDRPAFKNVICLGHILDVQGEKMSKTHGNVVDPWTVLNTAGADALRWYLFTSAPAGNVRRFSVQMVQETLRSFVLTLWNTYSFFVMYANIDNFDPKTGGERALSDLDRWIISELNRLVADVRAGLEGYDPTTAARRIESFVDNLSNWYVRRSRRRFWKSENDTDKLAAHSTLWQCLATLSKLVAPFMPFVAEEMYQNLVRSAYPDAPDSVHLADFPQADLTKVDNRLSLDTQLAIKVSSLGRAARAKAQIKVRQPLAKALVLVHSDEERQALERVKSQILEEINVKDIEAIEKSFACAESGYAEMSDGDAQVVLVSQLSPALQAEGTAREVVRRLQTMRRQAGFEVTDHITVYYQGDSCFKSVMAEYASYVKKETLATELTDALPQGADLEQKQTIDGQEVTLAVRKNR
jgi:isoleucyl-tRNA synthetase